MLSNTIVSGARTTLWEMDPEARSTASRRLVQLIRDYMADTGLTQRTAAPNLGLSQNYISKLLTGERMNVSTQMLEIVMDKLRIHYDYFYSPDVETRGLTYKDFSLYEMRETLRRHEEAASGPRPSPVKKLRTDK